MRVLSLFFAIVALILLFTSATIIFAEPTKPDWPLPLVMSYNSFISSEGASSAITEVINAEGSKAIKTVQTADGIYTVLLRNDLLASGKPNYYSYYFHNNVPQCQVINLKRPLPVPKINIEPFTFSGQTLVNGKNVNRWSYEMDTQLITIYTDPTTQKLVGQANVENMDTVNTVFDFQFGASANPPDSTFDVPSFCNQTNAVTIESDDVDFSMLLFSHQQHHQKEQPSYITKTKPFHAISHKAHKLINDHKKINGGKNPSFPLVASKLRGGSEQQHVSSRQQEMNELFGLSPSSSVSDSSSSSIPEIDNTVYLNAARNQGPVCGGCHAFASVALAELFNNRQNGQNRTINGAQGIPRNQLLSVQSVLDCASGDLNGTAFIVDRGCQGGFQPTDMQYIVENGIPYDKDYPYDAATGRTCKINNIPRANRVFPFSKQVWINSHDFPNGTIMKYMDSALEQAGGFSVIINVLPDFVTYSDGIYDNPNCVPGLSHAVLIVGTGVDKKTGVPYWQVMNSFGTGWGQAGTFRMRRGVNMCGIEDFAMFAIPSQK